MPLYLVYMLLQTHVKQRDFAQAYTLINMEMLMKTPITDQVQPVIQDNVLSLNIKSIYCTLSVV